jgi:hypothetical protein
VFAALGLVLAQSALSQQCPPPPPVTPLPGATRTAVAVPTDFPNSTGRFEVASVTTHQYAPVWLPWAFQILTHTVPQPIGGPPLVAGSGIAKDGAPLLAQSVLAYEGQRVAFLHGTGHASCTVA